MSKQTETQAEVLFTESPASWNTRYLTPDGFICQLTLREDNGVRLLEKTQAIPISTSKPRNPLAIFIGFMVVRSLTSLFTRSFVLAEDEGELSVTGSCSATCTVASLALSRSWALEIIPPIKITRVKLTSTINIFFIYLNNDYGFSFFWEGSPSFSPALEFVTYF